jgi:flagellar hook-length control protein FliK
VKTLAEFLNTSPQNISAPQKEESNQSNAEQQLNRIAAACEAAAHYAPIRIKLHLEHLGTLTLRFFYNADKLALRFETPSKESARFIQDNLDGLRTILSKRNGKIACAEIEESQN